MSFDKLPQFPYNQKKGGDNMAVSEAKKRANEKWNKANYKRLNIALPFAEFEQIENYCKEKNISKNGFLRQAALEKIERDS